MLKSWESSSMSPATLQKVFELFQVWEKCCTIRKFLLLQFDFSQTEKVCKVFWEELRVLLRLKATTQNIKQTLDLKYYFDVFERVFLFLAIHPKTLKHN